MPETRTLEGVSPGMSLVNQFSLLTYTTGQTWSNHVKPQCSLTGKLQTFTYCYTFSLLKKMRLGWRRQQVLSANLSFEVFLGYPTGEKSAHRNWNRNTSRSNHAEWLCTWQSPFFLSIRKGSVFCWCLCRSFQKLHFKPPVRWGFRCSGLESLQQPLNLRSLGNSNLLESCILLHTIHYL